MRLYLLGILLLLISTLNAQEEWFIGGVNFSNLSTNGDSPTQSGEGKTGFHVGAQYIIHIEKYSFLSLETAFLFSTKGNKISSTNNTIHNFNIPLALRFHSNPEARSMFFGSIGPYLGYVPYKYSTFDYKRFDLGTSIGAGVKVSFIQLSFYYDYGLTDISTISGESAWNRVARISVAFKN